MGRGRQKAKHTKVARDLKYFSPDTNYGALERELTHASENEPDYIDKWGDMAGVADAPTSADGARGASLYNAEGPDAVDGYTDGGAETDDESPEAHTKSA